MDKTMAPNVLLATVPMMGLARKIYEKIGHFASGQFELSKVKMTQFANGEFKPKVEVSVRRRSVYLIHDMQFPDPSTCLAQLLLLIDLLSRADVEEVILVLPYLSYMRQDRKDESRVPISAAILPKVLRAYPGLVRRLVTIDMHCDQLQMAYDIPVDNLPARLVFAPWISESDYRNCLHNAVVISPDKGGLVRAARFARSIGIPENRVYSLNKQRPGPNQAAITHFVGDAQELQGRTVFFYDDMLDTCGSMRAAIKFISAFRVLDVLVLAAHGLFSETKATADKPAVRAEDLLRQVGAKVVIVDTISRTEGYLVENNDLIHQVSCADVLAKAIYQSTIPGGSVSELFEEKKEES